MSFGQAALWKIFLINKIFRETYDKPVGEGIVYDARSYTIQAISGEVADHSFKKINSIKLREITTLTTAVFNQLTTTKLKL